MVLFTGPLNFDSAFMRPFKITFKSDSNELTTASGTADTNEESFVPGGIVGFHR